MNIEDLIILLATRCQMNPFDSKIVWSFYDQISRGSGFTEKQCGLAIKILNRHLPKINDALGKDAGPFLINPIFRLGKRTVSSLKRISIVPHEVFIKAIKVEFPFNEHLVEQIRKARTNLPHAGWDKDEKAWIFSLHERAIQLLGNFITSDDFQADDEFHEYLAQVREIEKNLEKYVPMVSYREKIPKFINFIPKIAPLETESVVESLFIARKLGIHTWDESVSSYLAEQQVNNSIMAFLDTPPQDPFPLNLEENSINDIKEIVRNLSPAIFIIPGGSELEKTKLSIDLLNSIGVTNSEISILFRLPKETGEIFNTFVKDLSLNNPVNNNTKAVIISSKIPKTIIDPSIKFNCIVNFNFYSVHYTIREFIKHHENVIHIMEKKSQRDVNFAFM
jgi:hypothetical protein